MRISYTTALLLLALCTPCVSSNPLIGLTLSAEPLESTVIVDDYEGQNRQPIELVNTTKLNETPAIDNNYVDQQADSTIELQKPATPGLIKSTALLVGSGLYKVGNYSIRVVAGSAAIYYYAQIANQVFSNAAYTAAMYYGSNIAVCNLIYVFSLTTCLPVTTMIVFYVGFKSPDLVYYTGKTIIKTVQLTGQTGILAFKGTKYSVKHMMEWLQNRKNQKELIELAELHQPIENALIERGN